MKTFILALVLTVFMTSSFANSLWTIRGEGIKLPKYATSFHQTQKQKHSNSFDLK